MGSSFRLGRPTSRARELRNNATPHEQLLWLHLRAGQLHGLKFSRQLPIGPFICDFVCRRHKLVVELDGSQHVAGADNDAERTAVLNALGYRVIRFWNNELTSNLAGVLETIGRAALGNDAAPTPQPPPASGRGSE